MEKFDISVIVPVYNAEKTIRKCLNSLIAQKNVRLEIICINDGSKDNTLNNLEKYECDYDNIVVVSQQNKGVSKTRNLGIDMAKGNYIMFVDADDFLKEDSLCTIDLSEQLDLYKFGYAYSDKNVYQENAFENKKILIDKNNYQKVFVDVMNNINENMVWAQLYKREILEDIRFDTNIFYAEDILFNSYVLRKIKTLQYIDSIIYFYERQDSSVTNNFTYEIVKNKVLNICTIFETIIKENPDVKKDLEIKSIREALPQIIMMNETKYNFVEESEYLQQVFKDIKPSDISEVRYKIGYSLLTKKHYKLFRIYNKFYMFLKKLKNSK